jgi:uncharacterized protein YdeI (YjbR/CyaY-like superfamily)
MGTTDKRVDAYIAKSADFAKPILTHIRAVVHETCPDVEETMKWNFPHFVYKGMLCSMASFKEHCAFGFWNRQLVTGDPADAEREGGMGQFGRLTKMSDLPSKKILAGYIKKAMTLNEQGVKPARPTKPKKELVVPEYFIAALHKNKKALAVFERFPPSHKREYVEWVTEAKGEDTRNRRLAQAVEWIAEGKQRNWKYM